MKRLTNGLKVWIAGSTLVGFLTGWSVLAHFGATTVDTAATLTPTSQMTQSTQTTTQVSALDTSSTSTDDSSSAAPSQTLQQLSAPASVSSNLPRLRTSGS